MATFQAFVPFTVKSSFAFPSHRRRRVKPSKSSNLKWLTSRIVQLTHRRQLRQIFEEIEVAKVRHGKSLNKFVMNAVLEACVYCGDIDRALKIFDDMSNPNGCGVDSVTYGILLKGLGEARRVDDAFQLLELIEEGEAIGSPKLSSLVVLGLLNALIEAGDLRRANGLLARYGFLLREKGLPSITTCNLLMKGYISCGSPQAGLNVYNQILRYGVVPNRLTYNTLILTCVRVGNMDSASKYFEEMKTQGCGELYPDIVTYTTLLKGFGNAKDIISIEKTVTEMKSRCDLTMDRTAFTAIVDAFLNCGSMKAALCVFGEMLKWAGARPKFRPKPHLFLSMMRAFAAQGNYPMVRNLHRRLWADSSGTISRDLQEEADHLHMESAFIDGQVELAGELLAGILTKWRYLQWGSRGGLIAVRIEASLGMSKYVSVLRPRVLNKVSLNDSIESIMIPLESSRPLLGSVTLRRVMMRFYRDPVVPILDDWGNVIGVVYREDCVKLDDALETMMRVPPRVATTASVGSVINLVLEKKCKMVIVVSGITFGRNSRAVGVFTADQLSDLLSPT